MNGSLSKLSQDFGRGLLVARYGSEVFIRVAELPYNLYFRSSKQVIVPSQKGMGDC